MKEVAFDTDLSNKAIDVLIPFTSTCLCECWFSALTMNETE